MEYLRDIPLNVHDDVHNAKPVGRDSVAAGKVHPVTARIPVATILNLVAEGQTAKDIVSLDPDLEAEDVREALLYAAKAVRERARPLAAG